MRRIVRGIGRVLKGERPEQSATQIQRSGDPYQGAPSGAP
jgi:hypothetical protein